MTPDEYKKLPKANRHLVAHEQPKGDDAMLYSVTTDGRLKIHRDLSKWRIKSTGKSTALYYSEAQSVAEGQAESKVRAVIGRCVKELTLAQEGVTVTNAMRKQALKDALASL